MKEVKDVWTWPTAAEFEKNATHIEHLKRLGQSPYGLRGSVTSTPGLDEEVQVEVSNNNRE